MEQTQDFVAAVYQWLNPAYHLFMDEYGFVNGIQAAIIALIVANNVRDWSRLLSSAAWATGIYVAADVLLPVIVNHVPPRFPTISGLDFWWHLWLLFAGYVIVIALLFAAKKRLFGPQPAARI